MRIKVDFNYKQKFLPTKRHKNARQREIADSIEVNVNELTAAKFPIAFIVHDYMSFYPGMKSYDDYDRVKDNGTFEIMPEEIRTINGNLYKPVRITHGTAKSDIFEQPETYIKAQIEWAMRYGYWGYGNDEDEFSEKSIVTYDNKRERRNEARKKAKGYIVFDNKVWAKCNEPRYVINTFGLGHNHGGTGFFIEEFYNPNIGKQNYFNALQYDEAVAYGKEVALRRGDTESVDGMGKEYIEVLMPEMVKCNPNKEHGNGNPFMNDMNEIIDGANSTLEAGLLCLAFATMNGAKSEK